MAPPPTDRRLPGFAEADAHENACGGTSGPRSALRDAQAADNSGAAPSPLQALQNNADGDARMLDGTNGRDDEAGGQKVISQPGPPFADEFLSGLKPWMKLCIENVESLAGAENHADARALFVKIVERWVAIEGTQGYKQEGRKLPAKGRPPYVHEWIQRARRTVYKPDLLLERRQGQSDTVAASAAFDQFRHDMRQWWWNINPTWRAPNDDAFTLRREAGDWSALYCTGANDLVSVVKCMKWWWEMLDEVDEQPGDRDEWRAAAADVAWTFEQVLAHGHSSLDERPAKRRKL